MLAEPDGTFLPSDIFKLLVFSDHCDAVFGTRTTRELIWHGANMERFLRWGNWAVAKLIEALFNTSHLSDVGCTYRLFRRELAHEIAERMRIGGNHAGPEMMLLTVTSGARFVEIPVNYLPRVGTSSATGEPLTAIAIGIRMIGLILRFRARTPRRLHRPRAARRRPPSNAATRPVSDETFDRIAGDYDESLPPLTWSSTISKAGRLRASTTARRARRSTSAAAPASWPRGWRRRAMR